MTHVMKSFRTVEREACVDAFAARMKHKLLVNAHKGDREGWRKDTAQALIARLKEEVVELEDAVEEAFANAHESPDLVITDADTENIIGEAADVGNFAMFIADLFDALGIPYAGGVKGGAP